MLGYQYGGFYDQRRDAAEALALRSQNQPVFESVEDLIEACGTTGIYDIAVPGKYVAEILNKIPEGAYTLIQKPLGETLEQAKEILRICQERRIHGAINFQLRWAPVILKLKEYLSQGELGRIQDVEFQVCCQTPWALWKFLESAPRMEMIYHSIHYIDCARHIFGEPKRIFARSIKDEKSPLLESSRSFLYFDYGDWKRCTIRTLHSHPSDPKYQVSTLKVEGTEGVARIQLGLNLSYPVGEPDTLEVWTQQSPEWQQVPVEGNWIPHAFRGPMQEMMQWKAGGEPPSTEVHDAFATMELVDQAYRISDEMASS